MEDQWSCVLIDLEELGDKEFLVLMDRYNIEICCLRLLQFCFSTSHQTKVESAQNRSEDNLLISRIQYTSLPVHHCSDTCFPWRTALIRSHNSSAGIWSNINPASKEMISDSVELCEPEVCFLHIQLIGTNLWLPKKAQCSSKSGFRIFKISCKVRILKQSQSAAFRSVSHMTILFVFTCMMNVRYQTR